MDDFTTKANADAYDKNVRWLASRPWIQIVSLDDIANGNLDISTPPDGTKDVWGTVSRPTNTNLANVSPDYVDHATQESYDHWYFGQSGLEESLAGKIFNIRTGSPLPQVFGQLGSAGLLSSSWSAVQAISPLSDLQSLARITTHAGLFVTAFHDQTANDLSKFSTGAYIYPDTSSQSLANFSKNAQSQVRFAAVYQRVDTWRAAANAGSYLNAVTAESSDVDLDGEPEYVLYNDRIFALFERIGGRLVGAWVRDTNSGEVIQTIGNPMSYSGSETEEEGTANTLAGQVGSYRTSGLKDWFAAPSGANYVNNLYTASAPASGTGWKLTSSDGKIAKTVTLSAGQNALQISYTVASEFTNLYIRFGLSPNLQDLLLNGQTYLSSLGVSSQELNLYNNNPAHQLRTYLRIGGGTYTGATYNPAAIDDNPAGGVSFDTLNMRNQAQTQQVEVFGSNTMNFALGFETGSAISFSDADLDGLPDAWENLYGLSTNDNGSINIDNGPNGDPDHDGISNIVEWLVGLNPKLIDNSAYPKVSLTKIVSGFRINFPTLPGRKYQLQSSITLNAWDPFGEAVVTASTAPPGTFQMDDTTTLPKRFYRMVITAAP